MRSPLYLALPLLLLAACDAPARRPLEVAVPARLASALSTSLCDALEAQLTFARVDLDESPEIDHEALEPVPGKPCSWRLPGERQLLAGTYSLRVDFRTRAPNPRCGKGERVLAGVYLRNGIEFPDGLTPLTEADFFSRPTQAAAARELSGEDLAFDADGDGSDNLTELSVGADPCHKNSVPQPSVEVPVRTAPEGTPLSLTFGSKDDDDVPHQVTLTLAHANAGYEPRVLTVTAYSDDRLPPTVSPDPAATPWDQGFDLTVVALQDDRPGAGRWVATFTPGTPFVNGLVAQVTDRDVAGTRLSSTEPVDLEIAVVEAAHPPRALPTGAKAPQDAFSFTEQGSDAHSFTVVDSRLGSPSSKLTPAPGPDFPPGLSLELPADGTTVLRWAPTNAQAVAAGSYPVTVLLRDANNEVQPPGLKLTLTISPLFNDAPTLVPPAGQFLSLPPPARFTSPATVPFTVTDVDQVPAAPRCVVTAVTPLSGTSCAQPFDPAPTCGPTGPAVEGKWPFAITLSPAAGYAGCGAAPEFKLAVKVTDSKPAAAWNEDQEAVFEVQTRTSRAVVVANLGPSPADSASVFIDGTIARPDLTGGTALFVGSGQAAIADLGNSTAGFKKTFPSTELCSPGALEGQPYTEGVVDPVHHRVALLGKYAKDPKYAGCTEAFALVDLAARSAVVVLEEALCAGISNPTFTNPVVDAVGNVYFACGPTSLGAGRLIKVDAAGARTSTPIPSIQFDYSSRERQAAVVPGSDGHSWMVIPTRNDFTLVDLDTLAGTPTIVRAPVTWSSVNLDERVVDATRHAYVYLSTHTSTYASTLGRLVLPPAPTPKVELLAVGGSGYSALRSVVLRQPYQGVSTPRPHALVTLGEKDGLIFYGFYWVDLDAWTVTQDGLTDRFHFTVGNERLWETPDRRYFLQVFPANAGPDNFALHPWKGGEPLVGREEKLSYNLASASSSAEGFVTVLTTADNGTVVLGFPDAAWGYDQ